MCTHSYVNKEWRGRLVDKEKEKGRRERMDLGRTNGRAILKAKRKLVGEMVWGKENRG